MDYDNIIYAPVVMFVFNRPDNTYKTLKALSQNYLAPYTEIFIYSDGPRNDDDLILIKEVRDIINLEWGFKKIHINKSHVNKGLASSVIQGVTEILNTNKKIIVVEDDLITTPNFLDFMNQSLVFYENNEEVISVTGFTLPLKNMPTNQDFYVGVRASSWTWGTWADKWHCIDWGLENSLEILSKRDTRKKFNRGGSDMCRMLKNQIEGKIDSWAIRFCAHQFKHDMLTVFPTSSKVINIGFGSDATHTKSKNRFKAIKDCSQKRKFLFTESIVLSNKIMRSFREFYSVRVRVKDKVNSIIMDRFKSFGS